jgi:hypothetical protein
MTYNVVRTNLRLTVHSVLRNEMRDRHKVNQINVTGAPSQQSGEHYIIGIDVRAPDLVLEIGGKLTPESLWCSDFSPIKQFNPLPYSICRFSN